MISLLGQVGLAIFIMWGGQPEAGEGAIAHAAGELVEDVQSDTVARVNAQLLLGMSPEAIAAVGLDSDRVMSALRHLVEQKALVAAARDNAAQLHRAERDLQNLGETSSAEAKSLILEIRSRKEGSRLLVQDCRERVFGEEIVGGREFQILVAEVSPWDRLPLPYRTASVSAELAQEVADLYSKESAISGSAASNLHRRDQLYVHLDSMDGVAEARERIKGRLSEVLEILGSIT